MDFLFKSPALILSFLPMVLIKLGNYFKNKDDNTVGSDDAFGNVLIALAPAIAAIEGNDARALRKALVIVRDTIDNYLTR